METNIHSEQVMVKKEKLTVNVEQIIENDISLADYYGDIVKILGNSVTVNIFSSVITGDKAIVDGSVKIRTLYINNEGDSEIFETDCPFNRSIDVRNCENSDIVSVSVISEQVNCRAVNQRRTEIRGSVTLKVSVLSMELCNIISAEETDLCHVLPYNAQGYFLSLTNSKFYTVTSSDDVNENIKAKQIYRVSTLPVVNEVRTIKNKMMIKGSVTVDVVMLTKDNSFAVQKLNIPINQIADIDGIDEDKRCCVSVFVKSCDVRLTADTPQAPAQIEASVIIEAITDAYIKTDINAVSDAYSNECELICKQSSIKCTSDIIKINENYTVSTKMDFSSCNATDISDVSVKKIRYTVQLQGNVLIVKGNIYFGVVVCSGSDKLYFDRISDFEYSKQFGTDISECEFNPNMSINGINYSINDNSQASVNAELYIDGCLNVVKTCNIITSIEKGQEKKCNSDDGIITVYFASEGEKIWDIAREYNSSVSLIKSLNELTEDVLSENKMIVFEQE